MTTIGFKLFDKWSSNQEDGERASWLKHVEITLNVSTQVWNKVQVDFKNRASVIEIPANSLILKFPKVAIGKVAKHVSWTDAERLLVRPISAWCLFDGLREGLGLGVTLRNKNHQLSSSGSGKKTYTLLGTNISHLWKRKIFFPATFKGDMLVAWMPKNWWMMRSFQCPS